MPEQDQLIRVRPWDKLNLSRSQYHALAPWKRAGMKRKVYEEMLVALPDELIQEIQREGEAESLIEMIFGQVLDG